MALQINKTSRCLDKRLKILGFEIPELLAICITASLLNFLFGSTDLKLWFVWLPTLSMIALFYFGKRGKPDNYLIHWLRFQVKPGIISAARESKEFQIPPTSRGKDL